MARERLRSAAGDPRRLSKRLASMSIAELWPGGSPVIAGLDPEAPGRPVVPPAQLTIVIPTLNERDNVPLMVERLNRVLAGGAWEAIFVGEDSPAGTADAGRGCALR